MYKLPIQYIHVYKTNFVKQKSTSSQNFKVINTFI